MGWIPLFCVWGWLCVLVGVWGGVGRALGVV